MTKKNKLIHTPEGVRDIYNGECRRKLAVQEKILHTLYLYGYEHIQTPSFEYADIFNEDRGSVGSPGNVQVLRQGQQHAGAPAGHDPSSGKMCGKIFYG